MEVRALRSADEMREAFGPLAQVFSFEIEDEWLERDRRIHPAERMLVVEDGARTVGCAGAFPLELTVPGGELVPAAGVTWVAVLPTHRRRGALRALVERQLADARTRGEPLAILWASEGSIYGRFGYGLATVSCDIDVDRDRAAFTVPVVGQGRLRLLELEQATAEIPPVYERARAGVAGMLARSAEWWEAKALVNPDYSGGRAGSPLRSAVLELDGRDEAYAIYRLHTEWNEGSPAGRLHVVEAIATSGEALREVWSYLFGIDLVARIHARRLPPDHPLFVATAEPARLRLRMGDGLWLRLVDLEAALAARRVSAGDPVVVEVADADCPWNAGVWRLGPDGAERTDAKPELRLGIAELGSVYLGGFTFAALAWSGRVEALVPGALECADRLFRTDRMPWCPELF